MKKNYGQQLDKHDAEKAKSLWEQDLFQVDIDNLRRLCFGRTIQKLQNKPTTLISGQTGETVNDIAPFLYFYDSLVIDLCPGCPQAIDPSQLKPYLDRGLITVIARANFQNYFTEFQDLAYTYPEYFIGINSLVAFRLFSLNKSFPHEHNSKVCIPCSVRDTINPYRKKIEKMSENKKMDLFDMIANIEDMPTLSSKFATDIFVDAMKKPTSSRIKRASVAINLMSYLTNVKALKSIPQFRTELLGTTEFLKPLRINHDKKIEISQYLDIIKDYKGTLLPSIIPQNEEKMLAKVIEINEEIDKIESSKRAKVFSFLSSFVTDIPRIVTKIVSQGSYGAEGVYQNAIQGYKSARLSKIKSKVLSKVVGVDQSSAQIWQIRKTLEKRRNY